MPLSGRRCARRTIAASGPILAGRPAVSRAIRVGVDETMTAPTDGGEPRARADDGSPRDYCPEWLTPAVEVGRRRAGIQTAFSRAVLSAVHQHEQDTLHTKPRLGSFTTAGIRGTVDPLRSASGNATRACCAVIAATATSTQGFCPLGCSMPRCARR